MENNLNELRGAFMILAIAWAVPGCASSNGMHSTAHGQECTARGPAVDVTIEPGGVGERARYLVTGECVKRATLISPKPLDEKHVETIVELLEQGMRDTARVGAIDDAESKCRGPLGNVESYYRVTVLYGVWRDMVRDGGGYGIDIVVYCKATGTCMPQ